MIVPLALVSTQRMQIVQQILEQGRNCWYANFSWRPGKLFETVNRALTIFVASQSKNGSTFSTAYRKWNSDSRDLLIPGITYVECPRERKVCWVPKLGDEIERAILDKCINIRTTLSGWVANTGHRVYYRTDGGLYWKVFTDFAPSFRINGRAGHSSRETWFSLRRAEFVKPIVAVLSSDVFWWWYTITSNCRHLNPYDLQNFPIPDSVFTDPQLSVLGGKYLGDINRNSTMLVRIQKQTGRTETQSFKIQKSKAIIDKIDRALAEHYGFTEEELDFILNHDIKYRLGQEEDEGAEE